MKIRITERAIARLRAPDPSGKQKLYWDSDLRGFGLLCSGVNNAKTFVVQGAVNGGTRRVTIARANVFSVAEARQRAREVIASFYRGEDPRAPRRTPTLRQALDDYLAAGGHRMKPKTARDLRAVIERYLADWLDRRLAEITGDMVEARHRSIRADVAAGGRGVGKATANAAMQNFGSIWSFAAERDAGLPANPTVRLRRQWFRIYRRERIVRAADLPAFYRAVRNLDSPVARDYILLLLFTGLRRTEAAGLEWSDIDFVEKVIRIPAGRTKAGRKLDLPMTDFVHSLLVARRAVGRDRFVFSSRSEAGFIAEPKFPLKKVAAACDIAVSAHDLRRTFITVAESCDISAFALKALINHSTADVTSGYVIMSAERLRAPAQAVCDKLKSLCGVEPPAADRVVAIGR